MVDNTTHDVHVYTCIIYVYTCTIDRLHVAYGQKVAYKCTVYTCSYKYCIAGNLVSALFQRFREYVTKSKQGESQRHRSAYN